MPARPWMANNSTALSAGGPRHVKGEVEGKHTRKRRLDENAVVAGSNSIGDRRIPSRLQAKRRRLSADEEVEVPPAIAFDGPLLKQLDSEPGPWEDVFDLRAPSALVLPQKLIDAWEAREQMQHSRLKARRDKEKSTAQGNPYTQSIPTKSLSAGEFAQLFLSPSIIASNADGPVCAYIHCQSSKVRNSRQKNLIHGHAVCSACKNYHRDHDGAMRNPQLCAVGRRREKEKGQSFFLCSNPNCGQVVQIRGESYIVNNERVCNACGLHWRRQLGSSDQRQWRPKSLCHPVKAAAGVVPIPSKVAMPTETAEVDKLAGATTLYSLFKPSKKKGQTRTGRV